MLIMAMEREMIFMCLVRVGVKQTAFISCSYISFLFEFCACIALVHMVKQPE